MSEPDSKKRRSNWMPLALLVGLVAYFASFGPACWLLAVNHSLVTPYRFAYAPAIWVGSYGPDPVRNSIVRYANLGLRQGHVFLWDNQLSYQRFLAFH